MAEPEVFVSDTHPLVWFLTRNLQLSEPARTVLRQGQAGEALVYVPAIVLLEFLSLAMRAKVPWERLFELLLRMGPPSGFRVAPLDETAFSRMLYIVWLSPRPRPNLELHDLAILACALALDAKLITKDRKLVGQALVEIVW